MDAARAVWFSAPGAVELRQESLGRPGAGEILVQAISSGISHGTEMLVYRGQIPRGTALDLPTLAGSFAFPIKYGYASVGTVVEVGADVSTLAMGDNVFCLHPHQTAYVLSADLAWRLPAALAPERAVFAANVETALNALLDAPVRLGERVVVLGQGTVGLLIGLLARRNGAGRVVVVDPIPLRRLLATELGADAALAPAVAAPDRLENILGWTSGPRLRGERQPGRTPGRHRRRRRRGHRAGLLLVRHQEQPDRAWRALSSRTDSGAVDPGRAGRA